MAESFRKRILPPALLSLHNAKRYCSIIILLFFVLLAHAQWRTAEEAEKVFKSTQNGQSLKKSSSKLAKIARNPKLLYTERQDGHNTIYVFGRTNNDGIVMVGGLDGVDILGFTDEGGFDIGSIPPALKQMMKLWSEQQISIAGNPKRIASFRAKRENVTRNPIEHLVQTYWNQTPSPYNDMCPKDCYTGCMATMFAQIMKYYNYPKHGTGTHSYNWSGQTLTANFGATEYKWDKMLDTYNNGCYDKESGNAIATLMYHVGVACDMNYGTTSSGAIISPNPLIKYFDYNANATVRDISGTDEDIRLMYEQLEKRQPIPYSGFGSYIGYGGGHAFIVDGYQDGLWGINWGWGGNYDGYFRLGSFIPNENSNYSYKNQAFLNLVPNGSYTPDQQGKDGEFTVSTPGSLKGMLGKTRYSRLTIHGTINGDDLRELRARCSCSDNGYMPTVAGLKALDLTDANIVKGGIYCSTIFYDNTHPDGYTKDYIAEDNTLGNSAFANSMLEELSLPSSVKRMDSYSISYNRKLKKLVVPAALDSYEDYAIWVINPEVRIEAPQDSKPIVEDNALYLQDHKTLCLVAGTRDKFIVDDRCQKMAAGAVHEKSCQIETLVIPQLSGYVNFFNAGVKKLWIAGKMNGMYMSSTDDDRRIDLYMPSDNMVQILHERGTSNYINNIYVPSGMMSQYKNDSKWSTYNGHFKALGDIDICVDDRRLSLPQSITLSASTQETLLPLIYDSKLADKAKEWATSEPSVATVDGNGTLTALAKGTADISLTIDGCKAICHVVVNSWPTVNVEQPGTLPSLIKGKEYSYLAVTGKLNGKDIRELRVRAGGNDKEYTTTSKTPLEGLDLTDADIVGGETLYVWTYEKGECVANTISSGMFYGCNSLKSLLLPNSATVMNESCVYSQKLQFLHLPSSLRRYEEGAIYLSGQNYDISIDVPASSCIVMKDGMLYQDDFSTLYLCLSKGKKVIVDPRCTRIGSDVADNVNCKMETLIAPNVTVDYSNIYTLKHLWIGGDMEKISPYILHNDNLCVFLPNKKRMARLYQDPDDDHIKLLYVPSALLDSYKADERWSKFAREIKPIEECGVVLDDCGVLMAEHLDMYARMETDINPQLLDTRLYGSAASFSWTSGNKEVASVDNNGLVTAKAAGETDVTLTVGDIVRTCRVTVKEWPAINVDEPGTLSEQVNDKQYVYLRVTGNINGDDLRVLRNMAGSYDVSADGNYITTNEYPSLKHLDMSNANLCQGGVYALLEGVERTLDKDRLPESMFLRSQLVGLLLPATANKADDLVLFNNNKLEYVEVPFDMDNVGWGIFAYNNENLLKVIYPGTKFLKAAINNNKARFGNATLYVRESLLGAFRQDVVYASAFKAIEPLDESLYVGIEHVGNVQNAKPHVIYNVMGQRMRNMQKGINIVDGKKIIKMK